MVAGTADILVIGGGIAGLSLAGELAPHARVTVVESEAQPGYHATGRSAALFSTSYGPRVVRRMTAAGRPFFEAPPERFCDHPLVTPRGVLIIAPEGREAALAKLAGEAMGTPERPLELIDGARARAMVPILKPPAVSLAAWEADALDIDVHGLLQGYCKRLRGHRGRLVCDARVAALERAGNAWTATTAAGTRYSAPLVVNAAGAWGDEIAGLAGARPRGLVARRRTGVIVKPPPGLDVRAWPAVGDMDESFYFKPEAGALMLSPADATPVPPQDARPEELDVARAVSRFEGATTLKLARVAHKWAGLRTFAPDDLPVVGFDGRVEGFFWLAGQGGWGVQGAPTMSRLAAALVLGQAVPDDLAALGLTARTFAPTRFG